MTTAIVHHPVFEKHDTGPNHPETSDRYRVTIDALRGDTDLWTDVIEIEADQARRSQGVGPRVHLPKRDGDDGLPADERDEIPDEIIAVISNPQRGVRIVGGRCGRQSGHRGPRHDTKEFRG